MARLATTLDLCTTPRLILWRDVVHILMALERNILSVPARGAITTIGPGWQTGQRGNGSNVSFMKMFIFITQPFPVAALSDATPEPRFDGFSATPTLSTEHVKLNVFTFQ